MSTTLERQSTTSGLTDSELRVLAVLATGATEKTTARQLGISDRTVRRRVAHACDQIGVPTAIQALAWAARNGHI